MLRHIPFRARATKFPEIETDWDAYALEHFGCELEPDRNDDVIDRLVPRLARELGHAGFDAGGDWQWDDRYPNEERKRFASEWHRPIDWKTPVPIARYVPPNEPNPRWSRSSRPEPTPLGEIEALIEYAIELDIAMYGDTGQSYG